MRHLIDPLYFSVQETEALLDTADDICDNMENTAINATAKSLQLCSLNQVQEHVFPLNPQ